MQLSDLIKEYIVDCKSRRLATKTIAWYEANLRYFTEWLAQQDIGDDLAAFTLRNARAYSAVLADRVATKGTFVSTGAKRGVHALRETDQPLAANTVIGYLRTLKVFSKWLAAEEQGYLPAHVLAGLRLPRKPKIFKEALTSTELESLLGEFDLGKPIDMRDFAILLTYSATGLRATELTDLLLDDIRYEEGYLRVRSGKGSKTRVVNLPPEVGRAMLRYRLHYRPATQDPYLFVTRYGVKMTYNAIKLVLRRARHKSGIARLHAHLLRRTFGANALDDGMDLMTLKDTFGHEDIRTTALYLEQSERRVIANQRKANLLAGVTLPKAVRPKPKR